MGKKNNTWEEERSNPSILDKLKQQCFAPTSDLWAWADEWQRQTQPTSGVLLFISIPEDGMFSRQWSVGLLKAKDETSATQGAPALCLKYKSVVNT